MSPEDGARTDAIAEAVAAFDAANHAWGRFFVYILRRYNGAPPATDPAALRAARQEAAISAREAMDEGKAGTFAAALASARDAMKRFDDALPEELRAGDVLMVAEALSEAMAWLAPWSAGFDPTPDPSPNPGKGE